ncbi:MAG: hypothetical protein E6R14_11715 [Thermomicrobiales bacterium]|nr:MAG: hypothetical protein E6R14_11715 [Thermomicrobiales bacterium]
MNASRKRGKAALFTEDECRAIAAQYDGTSATIDALLLEHAERGAKRFHVINAARRGGYRTARVRKDWSPAEDAWLQDNWHKCSPEEVARHLGRTVTSVVIRKKRIGVARYDGPDYTIRELEALLKIDHRQWHEFIDRGWLRVWQRKRQGKVSPITRVSVESLLAFLRDHPEIVDFRHAGQYAIGVFELASLPDPPAYKQVCCESRRFSDGLRLTPHGMAAHADDVRLVERNHRFSMPSCADLGGYRFLAPLYDASPRCPRCGCIASRYAVDGVYSDTSDDTANLAMLAEKLGLRFENGAFLSASGQALDSVELMRYAFGTTRNPGRAARLFGKLLEKGLGAPAVSAVEPGRLRPNLLSYELTDLQEADLRVFLAQGAISSERWPGYGKRYLGAMALTRIPGRHMLMVSTRAVRDQWVRHFEEFAPSAQIHRCWRPLHTTVTIREPDGNVRSIIDIYSYATRHDFADERYVVCLYDESHHLPSNRAHRHAFVPCEFRMGQSASAIREDSRDDWIRKLTGVAVGSDWAPYVANGVLAAAPIRVLLVRDLEHKYRLADRLTRNRRAIVFCEALADGREMERRYGMPFVYSETREPLRMISAHPRVAMSRVGDAGVDVPDLEVVVDLSFLGGSRAQSLQRFGRLLHSEKRREHVILMTALEYEKRAKRIQVLRDKGFDCRVERAPEVPALKGGAKPHDPASDWSILFGRQRAA